MEGVICRLVYDESNNTVHFENSSHVNQPSEYLPDLIEYDKKFGKLPIVNGIASYNMFGAVPRGMIDWKYQKGVSDALRRLVIYTKEIKKISYEPHNANPLFKIYTHTLAEDSNLTRNTIMYAYYAMLSPHQYRGVVVVNRDGFYYTPHGNSVSMYTIAPEHYPENTTARGATIDFDQVLCHEFLHSLGLPHDPKEKNIMSAYYSSMSEYLSDRDVARLTAKYEKRNVSAIYLRGFLERLHRYSNLE